MKHNSRHLLLAFALALGCFAVSESAMAVPSYARQTGQDCGACHVGAFGPQLTPYGIKFKIGGYTESDGKPGNVPLSGMAVVSFSHTSKDQDAIPADGYKVNNNFAFDQASLFVAGKLAEKVGSFVQVTYDGVAKTVGLDQMDLRFAHATEVGGSDLVLGASLNNNPTLQDPFNTLTMWTFPYTGSPLAYGGVETATLVNGGLSQRVLGLSGYAFWDNHLYAELGTYKTLSPTMQARLGQDRAGDPGRLGGTAYWRLAWFADRKRDAFSVGLFGFNTSLQPDRTADTPSDHYNDVGIDAQYQFLGTREHVATVGASYIRERQTRDAMVAGGGAANLNGNLKELRVTGSYYYQQTWGVTASYFNTTGDADSVLYAANAGNVPDTTGLTLQADWTPWGKESSWGAPWANVRLGLQYTHYTKYDGAATNYDGAGRNASDNNTLYVFAWTSF